MEYPRSRSVYSEGRATRGQILKRLVIDLINSYLWFHILKLVSHINLSLQRTILEDALFVQFDKNKNVSLILVPISIKYLPDETKVLD